MNTPLQVTISIEWAELPTDGSNCMICETVIVGMMFQMVLFVNYEPIYKERKVCQHCYTLNDAGRKG